MALLPRGASLNSATPDLVRATLLTSLSPQDRAALAAQADLSGRLVPSRAPAVAAERVRAAGLRLSGTRLETAGAPAFVEYQARAGGNLLGLPGTLAGAEIEVWWRGAAGGWRSAVVRVPAGAAERWDLPLATPSDSIRDFRLVFRTPGTYELGGLSVGGLALTRAPDLGGLDR